LAVGQASSIHGPEIREGVAKEIHQLRQQVLSLANKRMGSRYLFSGQKILTRPFDEKGNYHGDNNKINIEINKDVYIPVNLTGKDIFFSEMDKNRPLDPAVLDLKSPFDLEQAMPLNRDPAAMSGGTVEVSIFDELRALENALLTDNHEIVQGLLERLDESI